MGEKKKERSIVQPEPAHIPAHKRGMLTIGDDEIHPSDLLESDPEKFKDIYAKYSWKNCSTVSKLEIYGNILDAMEEAAIDSPELLEDKSFYKNLSNRPRNPFAQARIALALCSDEERESIKQFLLDT